MRLRAQVRRLLRDRVVLERMQASARTMGDEHMVRAEKAEAYARAVHAELLALRARVAEFEAREAAEAPPLRVVEGGRR